MVDMEEYGCEYCNNPHEDCGLALETRQESVNGNASANVKEELIVGVAVCVRLNQHAKIER